MVLAHLIITYTILAGQYTILTRRRYTAGNAKHANSANNPKRGANKAADERTNSPNIIALNTP